MEDDAILKDESGSIERKMPSNSGVPASPIFFLSGCPAMVAGARRALINGGVDESNIQQQDDARLHIMRESNDELCDNSLSNQGISGHGRDF